MGKLLVTVQLDTRMAERLKETAAREYCSVGAVVRRAVAAHLQQVDGRTCNAAQSGRGCDEGI
jgi:hypothetical protein